MKPYIVPDSRYPYGMCNACEKKAGLLVHVGEPGGIAEDYQAFLCKACLKEALQLLESRENNKVILFDDKVLQVFFDFPDSEMRAVDVRNWFVQNGAKYKSRSNFGEACTRLHQKGLLFRRKEGNRIWYCIAREQR